MKKYAEGFIKRGAAFSGFGPIIMGIIYMVLDKSIPDFSLSGFEVFVAVVSTYLLAFIQAGASVFNQIDEWPVTKSLLFHFASVYISYVLCYVVNSWIPFEWTALLIFTGIFVVTYFVIYASVYFAIKATSKKMNAKIISNN